jgi:GntR family transcriptional regulator, rspAB operon transcriptional repressor
LGIITGTWQQAWARPSAVVTDADASEHNLLTGGHPAQLMRLARRLGRLAGGHDLGPSWEGHGVVYPEPHMARRIDAVHSLKPGEDPRKSSDEGKAAARAYKTLVRLIATCELAPGDAFNERDQAALLGMSRTPLREALHRLALEDLVETVPQRGIFVALLDPKEIYDNTVVREAIEAEILRRVIVNKIPIDYGQLDDLMARMEHSLEASDAIAFLEADEEFHLALAATAGNRPAFEAIRRSWIHVSRVRYLKHQPKQDLQAALVEHRAMVTGLREGDPDRVEKAVRAHMDRSRARLDELTKLIPDAFVTGRTQPPGSR